MSDPKKQRTRTLQDLKARLGKGPGESGSLAPSMPPAAQGLPAPALPPPAMMPVPGGLPSAFGQPPGFPMAAPNADPFAAGSPANARQEVRLVIDDKAVDDAEVGRKRSGRNAILLALGVLVGGALGYGAGSVMGDRRAYNATVTDGTGIFKEVQRASGSLDQASQLIDTALRQARGTPDKAPGVDFASVEAMRALPVPFTAGAFARKRYTNFKPSTVDALFDYHSKVSTLWEKFVTLAARTLPVSRRAELQTAAEAANTLAQTQTGCVPVFVEGQLACELVFVALPKQAEGKVTQVSVSSTRRGASSVKTIYTGQDLKVDPGQYVILTHTPQSVGVLGQQASVFAEYQRDLLAMRQLADAAREVQGRLERELGDVARLRPVLAF